MSLFIQSNTDNDFERNLEINFNFFKSSFEHLYAKEMFYDRNKRFFEIDHKNRKKIIVDEDVALEYLKKDFDSMLEYVLENEISDTLYVNYVLEDIINYFSFINIKIASDFVSYVLSKTKEMSNKYNKDFSMIGIDTSINLFRNCLYKDSATKKERENIYSYIFNERKDLLEIETYSHINGYYINKNREISQYFTLGLYILTNYSEYENQTLKFLKLLIYKKENTPSSYSFKDIDVDLKKIKNIPNRFFEIINIPALLVIRNYQGVSSKMAKKIDSYVIEHLLKDEESKINYAIYTAITLDDKYIQKINKKVPDIFSIYLKKSFEKINRNPHISYQCEEFIKNKNLNLNIRNDNFWENDFYPLIKEYIEEKK